MSQNTRNTPGDREGNSGRGTNDSQERQQYEGFEGMNYEQVRRPFNPRQTGNSSSDDVNSDGKGKGREEL
jgi:hypothetical protein